MMAHSSACSRRTARCNGVSNGPVFLVCLSESVLRVERKLFEIWIDTLIEQLADCAHQNRIAQHRDDGDVKLPVEREPPLPRHPLVLDARQYGIKPRHVLVSRPARSLLGNCTFDKDACTEYFEGPLTQSSTGNSRRGPVCNDINAGTDADPQASFDLQRNEGLANRRARNVELFGKLALSREPATDGILSFVNEPPQLTGDLTIEPPRFDRFERQYFLLARVPQRLFFILRLLV